MIYDNDFVFVHLDRIKKFLEDQKEFINEMIMHHRRQIENGKDDCKPTIDQARLIDDLESLRANNDASLDSLELLKQRYKDEIQKEE